MRAFILTICIGCAWLGPVDAADITRKTRCPVATAAFDATPANMAAVRQIVIFVKDTFDQLDDMHTDNGEAGIIPSMTDDGIKYMVSAVVEYCRKYPKSAVYDAAANVYLGYREMHQIDGAH